MEAWGSTSKGQDPYVCLNEFDLDAITTDKSPKFIEEELAKNKNTIRSGLE